MNKTKNSLIIKKINQFIIGEKVQGFFVCTQKVYKISKQGSPYLNIVLSDITGKIDGKVWENVDYFTNKFEVGNPVAIKGIPIEYNGQIQINILQINYAEPILYNKYGFKPELLIPTISENPESIYEKIISITDKIKMKELKELCYLVLKNNKSKIINSPASLNNHYPIKGGLILHIFNCLQFGLQCLRNFKYINKDLLITGLLLHDIGRIKCYSGEFVFTENDKSKLLGHVILGLEIINNIIIKIPNFKDDLKIKISHILLFNSKSNDGGELNLNFFSEAYITYNIYKINAKIDAINRKIIHLDNRI